jgi:ribulose-5-phosphate 4-epimerase/fuculose-1-phosphate aldolase
MMEDLTMTRAPASGAPDIISADEMVVRRDLAAAYRLAAQFGWVDILGTHFSARLQRAPGQPEAFLINPFGMLFEEITASSLVKVDVEGNILSETPYPVNKAGFVIHSALHIHRPDVGCIMHLHTDAGVAVSTAEPGLLPLNQLSISLQNLIAFHDYEGPATSLEERERLAQDVGQKNYMLLRNHGTLALGATVAETFINMYALESACRWQVQTLAMGLPLRVPDPEVVRSMTEGPPPDASAFARKVLWPSLLRKLDRTCPEYRD